MKTLNEILTIIKADVETVIPPVLAAEGLTNFEKYVIGEPRDSAKITCGILFDPMIPVDVINRIYPILYFLQLVQTEYIDALLYTDIFNDYITNFDAFKIRASILQGISTDIIPMERERSTKIYITATFNEPLDSCD